jgi:23S rRNA pseudouridine2605 synthase
MRDRPHHNHRLEWPGGIVPEWARPQQKRRGKGRGGKAAGGGKRERLQKVMAQSGYGSRRNIEILIAQGHITINGQVAKLGDSVGPGDKVKMDGNLINLRFGEALPRVMLYHKPTGEIVTRDDPEKRPTVFEKLPKVNGGRWVSVGRLDFNTEGLLVFTTSGELANRLTHPRFEVEREYAVRVMGELTDEQKQKLLAGVDIDGELCKFDAISEGEGDGSNRWYHVILREGKNREVRRMMEALGLMVSRLIRVRFGSIELPSHIKRGMMREMGEEEVQQLLAFAGMGESAAPGEEDEEDELDNIGNRAPEGYREERRYAEDDDAHPGDDDIGNRAPAPGDFVDREPREADGNRGTYGQARPPQQPGGGGRRKRGGKEFKHPQQVGDPRAFKPQGQGQPPHQAQGNAPQGGGPGPQQQQQPHPFRKRGRKKRRGHGGAIQPAQGQPHAQPQQPAAYVSAEGGAPPSQPPAGGAAPGQGKRHRRNRHRHRNRDGAGGNAQPVANGNRDEF